jgi:hypothetical protein
MNNLHLFIIIAAVITPLLLSIISDTQLYPNQASGQLNNFTTNSETTVTSDEKINATSSEKEIALRGIVSSDAYTNSTSEPNEQPHGAVILSNNDDGTIYTGVLTFTATKPVEVGISHRLHIDNSTFSELDTSTFGELFAGFHTGKAEQGTPGEISVPSVIVPDYGTAPPYFSASIPFVGDSVWLRTPHGEPFIAVYEVVAEEILPQGVVDLESIRK